MVTDPKNRNRWDPRDNSHIDNIRKIIKENRVLTHEALLTVTRNQDGINDTVKDVVRCYVWLLNAEEGYT